jgi:hypothetical protein
LPITGSNATAPTSCDVLAHHFKSKCSHGTR